MNNMSSIAAGYQTKVTLFTAPVAGNQRILKADADRWYVEFIPTAAMAVSSPCLPAPPLPSVPAGPLSNLPLSRLYRDCPSIVTGEWYMGIGIGTEIIIVECIHTKG